jgi:agmatinase
MEELYLTPAKNKFSGFFTEFNEAHYVIVGVPFDKTSTYRLGSNLGPKAIREASLNIETYSFRTGLDVEDLKICDLGDVQIAESLAETLMRLKKVIAYIVSEKKTPIILGGEHTITLGVVEALPSKTALVDFDAHFDLRDEYMFERYSHTTFMRRISEKIGTDRIFQTGIRAACKDELKYADSSGIRHMTSREILSKGWSETAKLIDNFLYSFPYFYITLDMDVLDPAYAPGVGNPEPEGISSSMLLDILQAICNDKMICFDLVEVAPSYDTGVTAVQAAKIIFEVMCFKEKRKRFVKL